MAERRKGRRGGTVLKIVAALALLLVLALGAVWLLGPREPVDLTLRFDPAALGGDLDAYLARAEADVPNLRPEAAKEIRWAYPASRARTPIALVYIHGFSASKDELRPLPDLVAQRLGANLFLTRLSGHGRNGAAMAEASVNDWWNDLAEALAIGRRLGERVVVIGNSTGGTLAVLGASDPELMRDVAGLVLLSPNFGPKDRRSFVLDLPFAREFGPRLFGPEWGATSGDPRIAAVWTERYPTVALLTMGALVRAARTSDIGRIALPALFLFNPNDKVVDPAKTRALIDRWPARKDVVEVPDTTDPNGHILAGDLVSPGTTEALANRIAEWVQALPKS
ncbi:alpha/beta hydrolase [Aureimonas leprariae]|uniref:Alpha/beta fold hydrolase n=1 Tax=Plantimonas leprariae TaxID=2615207 RepID=A0A7V7PSF6_9HYPH|nr:alpha/beta fold hydrolase [Aureimonas leprariae]KAB0682040.1 alpha/beta fold hydrolase [Aureimonas leprariae]